MLVNVTGKVSQAKRILITDLDKIRWIGISIPFLSSITEDRIYNNGIRTDKYYMINVDKIAIRTKHPDFQRFLLLIEVARQLRYNCVMIKF